MRNKKVKSKKKTSQTHHHRTYPFEYLIYGRNERISDGYRTS
jgi:hypothetical protein